MTESGDFARLASLIEDRFKGEGRVRSYWEYLGEIAQHPYRLMRSSAQYLRDMIESFGSSAVHVLGEKTVRHELFDGVAGDPERQRVVGQEMATDAIYRAVRNFAASGRADKMILMHGPNGSAKTSIVDLLMKGLEAYSARPEGALYRFSWVFPKHEVDGSGLGFGRRTIPEDLDTYAYLEPEEIASTVVSDLRTNPIYLVPREHRKDFLHEICNGEPDFPHLHILRGDMGTKTEPADNSH
jgi:hypothetical protein